MVFLKPSGAAVDLRAFGKVEGASDAFVKVHGVLMILAWLWSATSGMVIARYTKEASKGKQVIK